MTDGAHGQGPLAPGRASRVPIRRWPRVGLVVAIVALVGLPLTLSFITGSLFIPHNDAWSHARVAQHFAETGHPVLWGWNRSSLVGMVVVLGPYGDSFATQNILVAACGAVALTMTYLLVRSRAGDAAALLAAISLGVVPEFGLLSTSYMTDIPALAGSLVCLWAGDSAVRKNHPGWLWLSIVAGFWAITVREQALMAPVAVIATTWIAGRPTRKHAAACTVLLLAAVIAFEVWRRSLPFDDPLAATTFDPRQSLLVLGRGLLTVGFFLLPITIAVVRPMSWRRAAWLVAPVPVLVATLLAWLGQSPLLGNYMSLGASYARASVGAPIMMPRMVWYLLLAAAVLGATLLTAHAHHSGIPRDPLMLFAGAFVIAGSIGQIALGQGAFSRYLLILVPIGARLLLADHQAHRLRVGYLAAALIWLFGVAMTAGTLAYDAARWEAAAQLVARGVAPQDIDAGFEWVGTHAAGPYKHSDLPTSDADDSWYVRHFDGARACYVVSGRPMPNRDLVGTHPFVTFGVFGESTLHIYRGDCG